MNVDVISLAIPDVKLISPKKFRDDRGFFSETYTYKNFNAAGIEPIFVQDNHSHSVLRGTVRGLHFQTPPFAQDKLVRVTRGSILDIAVDLRRHAPTFGQHVAVTLSAESWQQLFVPIGFAHGFCTLEPDTEVLYKVSNYYAAEHDRGLLWNDPALGIAWPVTEADATLSAKDRCHPRLADLPSVF